MVPLARTLEQAKGLPVEGMHVGMHGDPEANFRAFVDLEPPDLGQRALGNWQHLAALYSNVLANDVQAVVREIEANGGDHTGNERVNAAGVNLMNASGMLHSALTLHLHPVAWNDRVAMAIARIALELAGRAALIGRGTADEIEIWDVGQFGARKSIVALQRELDLVKPDAPKAGAVYDWLCAFGHMDSRAAEHFLEAPDGGNEDAYASLAYVAWAVGVVAEFVIGTSCGVTYPEAMPALPPWDRPKT